MSAQINWESFATNNPDIRGIRFKFEDLCRQIFENDFLSTNTEHRYLNCNPNNPGIEADPVLDERTGKRIGFQAKYFETETRYKQYKQIKDSAKETVEHYAGQIDRVYLYCNKALTVTSKDYKETEAILKAANIELEPVTNDMILDRVRALPYLGLLYFGNHTIDRAWLENALNISASLLGDRYNREFNVSTECSEFFSLFIHSKNAAELFNKRKVDLIERIHALDRSGAHTDYLAKLLASVVKLPDVDENSLYDACAWTASVSQGVQSFLDSFSIEYQKLEQEQEEIKQKIDVARGNKEDTGKLYEKLGSIRNKASEVAELLNLPRTLEISSYEQSLLNGKVLLLYGDAGMGKSQLLAHTSKELLNNGKASLLLVSGIYSTGDPVQDQIVRHLQLDYSFDELLDVLEAYAERYNFILPIFIDALNESWYKNIWKNGLSDITRKICNHQMLRLVISYRTEYEELILPQEIIDKKNKDRIVTLRHYGFANNSIEAIMEFLNHYNIPFTPSEFFGIEFTNPLFLTLYCKTYDGTETNLINLYERMITDSDKAVFRDMGKALSEKNYSEGDEIIGPFIEQFASIMLKSGRRSVRKKELSSMDYWDDMGIDFRPFITSLIRSKLLYDYSDGKDEYYLFSYDQMLDYYSAKAIISEHDDQASFRKYLTENVLDIQNGKLGNPGNTDLFVMACAQYAMRYKEECIDIIDALKDKYEQADVFSRYVESFQWRDPRFIPADKLMDYLGTYPCRVDSFLHLLIGNSVKVNNPLNADYLHKFLQTYSLADRDYRWTLYINKLTDDDSDRLVQLIKLYNSGNSLDIHSEEQTELLLTLFGWVLTSSNRWLRDNTSKAMIEILKTHFGLCKLLLKKFRSVNDPYVVQRLCGIVLGACCKRTVEDLATYQELAEFVYSTIFDQEKVYPDILLRDYARMIIERFLYENPQYTGIIDRNKIVPPYKSDPIPDVPDGHYQDKEYDGSEFWIMHSMRFENMGMYGDFGRYVYQSALRDFDVDEYKIFNYSIYHIFNDLKYSDKYFGEHDKHCGSYDRHQTIKVERIGKKYQWITMMEVLARVSDHCKMIDRWNFLEKEEVSYDGAWEPYVRDFDPTLNASFMHCNSAPLFKDLNDFTKMVVKENSDTHFSSKKQKDNWLESRGTFLDGIKNTLILKGTDGTEWVTLTCYHDTDRKRIKTDKLSVWSWLYAYFVTEEQKKEFTSCIERGISVLTGETASHCETYTVYNREYPWAPSCKDIHDGAWVDVSLQTGEVETVTEKVMVPDLHILDDLLAKYGTESEADDSLDSSLDTEDTNGSEEPEIKFKEITRQREIEKNIGKILHATCSLLWEEEYDASKEEAISWNVPCPQLCESLHLKQLESDCFYFDERNHLAAFDVNLTQGFNRFVIRRDLLDGFLNENNLQLIWLVDAEKEIFSSDTQVSEWSEWQAVYSYEDSGITGDLKFRGINPLRG